MVCKLGREKPRQCRWHPLTFTRHGTIKKFFPEKVRFHAGKTWVSWWAKWHEQQRNNHYRLSIFLLSIVTRLLFFLNFYPKLSWLFQFVSAIFFWLWSSVTSIYCWFHVGKLKPCQGWGFIIQEDGGPNLFFHSNAIESGHYWCLVGNEGMGWLFIDHSPISLHHLMGYIMRYPGFYCWRQFWM